MIIPNSALPGGIHSDVLNATASTTDERTRLIEELKRRAKLAIVSKRFPEAEVLYSKAIEVLQVQADDNDANKELSVLYSNRSLCQMNVGKFAEAKDDAMLAVGLDQTYVKALFRLGSACLKLEDADGAVDAFEKALGLGPNKALEKELINAKKLQADLKRKAIERKKVEEEHRQDYDLSFMEKKVKESKEKVTKSHDVSLSGSAIDADGDFTKSDHVRGYVLDALVYHNMANNIQSYLVRLLSYKIINGKKTSFFHHEQTEEEKLLIGDITPKLIVSSQDTTPTAEQGVSAWNKAGTWEEKDVSPWARQSLEEALLSTCYTFPAGSLHSDESPVIKVTKVKGLDKGHASVASVRGKRRHMFEFTNVEVNWEVSLDTDCSLCSGVLTFHDVDGTCEGEYDIDYKVDSNTPGDARHLLDRFVKGNPDGLVGELVKCIDTWIDHFSHAYS